MALHRLLGMNIGTPAPVELDTFYREIGLEGGSGHWGTRDFPDQIDIVESPYRQLRQLRIGCHDEQDIANIAGRLGRLGVASRIANGELRVNDPCNGWEIVIQPAAESTETPHPGRHYNGPGDRRRIGERAEVTIESAPRPPRRLGHVVIGTPEIDKTRQFFMDGLGFRLSDAVAGIAFFLRCSADHHNFLIQPGPVPYLNHYAFEHDDIDAVARAASLYVRAHPQAHIDGLGRHVVGGNVFWYMKDPSGTFFEFFTDMDRLPDDWQAREDWPLEDTWSSWGSPEPPEVFFQPQDMDAVAAGYTAESA